MCQVEEGVMLEFYSMNPTYVFNKNTKQTVYDPNINLNTNLVISSYDQIKLTDRVKNYYP